MMSIFNLYILMAAALSTPFVVCYGASSSITGQHEQQQKNYMSTNSETVMVDKLLSDNVNQKNAKTSCDDALLSSPSSSLLTASSASSAASLKQADVQLRALKTSPMYQNMKNVDDIAESIAENRLKSEMLQGNINIVAPNTLKQTSFLRSVMIPQHNNNHQIITTQPLQPIVITQPSPPTAQLYSGAPTIVKASPVIYKLKPSIIYQQEIINKIPAPLSLNPVYVKVYKPGKQVHVPQQMINQADDVFSSSSSSFHYDQSKYSQDAMQSPDYTIGHYVLPTSTNPYTTPY